MNPEATEWIRTAFANVLNPASVAGALLLSAFAGLGVLVKHLWSKYRTRLIPLRWQVTTQLAGAATRGQTPFGKIDVSFNGKAVFNLTAVHVHVQNDSARDLGAFTLAVQFPPSVAMLYANAVIASSKTGLDLSPAYARAIDDLHQKKGQLTAQDYELGAYVVRRPEFQVPFLNRRDAVVLQFFVDSERPPAIEVIAVAMGARVVAAKAALPSTWEVENRIAAFTMFALSIPLLAAVIVLSPSVLVATLSGFLLGTFGLLIGAGAVRLWRFVARLAE